MARTSGRLGVPRAFLRLMVSRDDFTVVIKGAAYVEIAVKEFIEAHLARPEELRERASRPFRQMRISRGARP